MNDIQPNNNQIKNSRNKKGLGGIIIFLIICFFATIGAINEARLRKAKEQEEIKQKIEAVTDFELSTEGPTKDINDVDLSPTVVTVEENSDEMSETDAEEVGKESDGIASSQEEKNGFDINTAVVVQYGGYDYSVPDYMGEGVYDSDLNARFFYLERSGSYNSAYMCIASDSFSGTKEEFEQQIYQFPDAFVNSLQTARLKDSYAGTVDGNKAEVFTYEFQDQSTGFLYNGKSYVFFDDTDNSIVVLGILQTGDTQFSYFGDLDSVADNVKKHQ